MKHILKSVNENILITISCHGLIFFLLFKPSEKSVLLKFNLKIKIKIFSKICAKFFLKKKKHQTRIKV